MNDIREIVTRAVIAKGKKKITKDLKMKLDEKPDSILGCWIINHQFTGDMEAQKAFATGEFDIHVWYSTLDNKNTQVSKMNYQYNEEIYVRKLSEDIELESGEDVRIRILEQPKVENIRIQEDELLFKVEYVVAVELIGETKLQVNVLDNPEIWSEENFENEINENFIEDK